MFVQLRPESVVRNSCIPQDGARVPEGGFLTLIKPIRCFEAQQLVVVVFGKSLLSTLDRPLDASIVTFNRLGHIYPAEFLDRMVQDSVDERVAPSVRE